MRFSHTQKSHPPCVYSTLGSTVSHALISCKHSHFSFYDGGKAAEQKRRLTLFKHTRAQRSSVLCWPTSAMANSLRLSCWARWPVYLDLESTCLRLLDRSVNMLYTEPATMEFTAKISNSNCQILEYWKGKQVYLLLLAASIKANSKEGTG